MKSLGAEEASAPRDAVAPLNALTTAAEADLEDRQTVNAVGSVTYV